jgi:cytochrome c nitrite reductase small subunit
MAGWKLMKSRATRAFTFAGILLAGMLGALVGIGGFTFVEARGWSYLSNDPTTCVNCHIMREQYDSWQKSSHHAFATCNDCHVPQDFFGKYWTKAEHGARHSWGFTFQDFHEPIQIKDSSRAAVQGNCIRCHANFVGDVLRHSDVERDANNCIRCHSSVGHGANR